MATSKETHARYNQSAKGKSRHRKYEISPKGRLYSLEKKHTVGPAGSAGPVGAAAQRERRARPEYVLARRLGISVKLSREMLE